MAYKFILNDNRWKLYLKKIKMLCIKIFKSYEISICLTNANELHGLNLFYREKDKSTNVLSFPLRRGKFYGDIFLSYDDIKMEARSMKKPFMQCVIFLIIHGSLHLLGYDHIEDKDAEIMEIQEEKYMRLFYADLPYGKLINS